MSHLDKYNVNEFDHAQYHELTLTPIALFSKEVQLFAL